MANISANRRARNWCAVVYPDSAPSDWKDVLDNLQIKWACSPLHDKDVDDDGVLKKAHWHIVLCYSGNKSFDQVKEDLEMINCPIPQICRDVRSSVRYFIHLDHPHKYQYNKDDITSFGGFDVGDIFALSKSEKLEIAKTITLYIQDNNIKEYFDLSMRIMSEHEEWFEEFHDNSAYYERLLKSNRHRGADLTTSDSAQNFSIEKSEVLDERI